MKVEWQNILSQFQSIDLKSTLQQAALLEREDTKYLVPFEKMEELLRNCQSHYQLLRVNHAPTNGYRTVYFDTSDLKCYHDHHAGKLNRMKFRIREYLATKEKFIETKFKSNKGLSFKTRSKYDEELIPESLNDSCFPGLKKQSNEALFSTLEVSYQRITLVSKSGVERVTLDYGLIFASDNKVIPLEGLVFAEVKRLKKQPSFFANHLKQLGLRAVSVSKYCTGMALMREQLKSNRFKPLLTKLKKNCHVSFTNNQ